MKDPPPFPRDDLLEECEPADQGNASQDGGLKTIELSSDEDVGLEAEEEEEEVWPQDMENMEKSAAEKLKRSSLKKERGEQALNLQTDSRSDRLTRLLSAGGQPEEGFLPPEHREENEQDRNKNSFS